MSLPGNASPDYECKICGKNFSDSLGDMERHILTEHMLKADLEFLKTKNSLPLPKSDYDHYHD